MKGRIMTTVEPRRSTARGREGDLHRVGSVVVPRWLRQRRRAERLAARPSVLTQEIVSQVTRRPRAGSEPTLPEVLAEQEVRAFDPQAHRRTARLTGEDWAELRAALAEGRADD